LAKASPPDTGEFKEIHGATAAVNRLCRRKLRRSQFDDGLPGSDAEDAEVVFMMKRLAFFTEYDKDNRTEYSPVAYD